MKEDNEIILEIKEKFMLEHGYFGCAKCRLSFHEFIKNNGHNIIRWEGEKTFYKLIFDEYWFDWYKNYNPCKLKDFGDE